MANVKFYRLGENQGVKKSTYQKYCKEDGSIVFAKVNEENGSLDNSTLVPPSYYIWANGIEYKVANADVLNYIYTLVTTDDATMEGSVAKRIADAIAESELTPEKFMKIVNTEKSNIDVNIVDGSVAFTCENGATTEDIQSGAKVGYVDANMVIPEGTTLQELIEMIFTKTLGLANAVAPSVSVKLSNTTTKEIGSKVSFTATATYADGYWTNEKNADNVSWGTKTQAYGCVVSEYNFDGIEAVEQASNVLSISDYVVKASNKVTVTADYAASVNVPVNSKGEELTKGTVNNTSTYKPQSAGITAQASASFTGDYMYWIGYTSKAAAELTREVIEGSDFTIKNSGFAGTSISYLNGASDKPYNTPTGNYVTFVVPATMSLQTVTDSFNNDVTGNFTCTEISGIGKDTTKKYKVYQEYAQASAGLDRYKITIK